MTYVVVLQSLLLQYVPHHAHALSIGSTIRKTRKVASEQPT